MIRSKGSKRLGIQPCENCYRDFAPKPSRDGQGNDWRCPYCGFNNKVGLTFAKEGQHKANQKR